MMLNLRELFGYENRMARLVNMRNLMAEETRIRDYILKMMVHLSKIEILGVVVDGETQINIILQRLPKVLSGSAWQNF
jgi:hypothetical protein